MTTITELNQTLQTLLTSTANTLAKKQASSDANATRKQQQQAAVQVGMPISTQGLEQRFTAAAADFMKQLLEAGLTQLVCSEQARPLLPQFNGVSLSDCTRLAWGRAGSKLAVR